jgi:hypothetical protein
MKKEKEGKDGGRREKERDRSENHCSVAVHEARRVDMDRNTAAAPAISASHPHHSASRVGARSEYCCASAAMAIYCLGVYVGFSVSAVVSFHTRCGVAALASSSNERPMAT